MHTHHIIGQCTAGNLSSIPMLSIFLNAALVTQPVAPAQTLAVVKVSIREICITVMKVLAYVAIMNQCNHCSVPWWGRVFVIRSFRIAVTIATYSSTPHFCMGELEVTAKGSLAVNGSVETATKIRVYRACISGEAL